MISRRLAPILFSIGLLTACSPSGDAMSFGGEAFGRHRISGAEQVPAPPGLARAATVDVSVEVSPDGRVVAARFDPDGSDEGVDPAPAVRAARGWTFRPFLYRGEPVRARGTVQIAYAPPERWRDPTPSFPRIDYDSLRIALARGGCFGACPIYTVTIDGTGAVEFATPKGASERSQWQGVLIPGTHRTRIDRATLDALIERFRAARFFGLRAKYEAKITDNPTFLLNFRSGEREWTVVDYVGREVGMPWVVTELQRAVDAAAGTARWVRGTEQTVPALAGEGFDFRSPAAAALAVAAAESDEATDGFFLALIAAGLPLDAVGQVRGGSAAPVGETLLLTSVRQGRGALFAELARRGWIERSDRGALSAAFAASAGGCNPAIVKGLVAAGLSPDARSLADESRNDSGGATPLISAFRRLYGPCREGDKRPVIDALLAVGADVNAADAEGRTVLYQVHDPDLLDRLLAAGARADVRDAKGLSPAFAAWTDRIALGLLDAGADPEGLDKEGRTLRQLAAERRMRAVLAWLDRRERSSLRR